MKFNKLKNLVTVALFTAIICVATFIIKIPTPGTNGYFNLGDCFALLAGPLLGPGRGAFAAGLGSALADVVSGYPHYAPGTFVVKALMALSAYCVYKSFNGKRELLAKLASGICAEAVMVSGYFCYEAVFLEYGAAAAAGIPANTIQGLAGIAAAIAASSAIKKSKTLTEFLKKG